MRVVSTVTCVAAPAHAHAVRLTTMSASTTPGAAPVYLDHAATTPMRPEAVEEMTRHLRSTGNASSLHGAGRAARRVVEESRERVAAAIGARPGEVIFTSGGTEADNLAVKGIHSSRQAHDPARRRIISSPTEHHAVLDPLEWLAAEGAKVDYVAVDHDGRVDLGALEAALSNADDVTLVSVMWANNEVGTVQPVARIVEQAQARGVPVHTDAVQAVGALHVDFAASGLDALTLTAHKLGGPYGVGALVAGRGLDLTPLLHGGGQERQVRSGTLDVPAIAAFAVATEIAVREQEEFARRMTSLRTLLVERIREVVPDVVLNGDPVDRLPGNVHLTFPGCEGDSLLMLLDHQGVQVSTGSACSAGVPQPSHVLLAMGRSEVEARGSLRITFGHTSTESDVAALVTAIGPIVERARAALL
jgi:cysteine desulfurase